MILVRKKHDFCQEFFQEIAEAPFWQGVPGGGGQITIETPRRGASTPPACLQTAGSFLQHRAWE